MAFHVNTSDCIFCGLCAEICLFGAVECYENERYFQINPDKCLGCGQCAATCGNSAIFPAEGHKAILSVTIIPDSCIGCSLCLRACPAKAPHGEIKKPFEIDQSKCLKCGLCASKCRKNAIYVRYEGMPETPDTTPAE